MSRYTTKKVGTPDVYAVTVTGISRLTQVSFKLMIRSNTAKLDAANIKIPVRIKISTPITIRAMLTNGNMKETPTIVIRTTKV